MAKHITYIRLAARGIIGLLTRITSLGCLRYGWVSGVVVWTFGFGPDVSFITVIRVITFGLQAPTGDTVFLYDFANLTKLIQACWSPAMELTTQSEFKCPANGCAREAKLVRAAVEEFIHPVGGEKAAYYIVECVEHGQKLITMNLQPVIHQNRDPHRRRAVR